jgi:N-acetylglucosaminyl-diphospho-decaprenol L-rhamnosyltransferase
MSAETSTTITTISLSIVSHGQGALVRSLLEDIKTWTGARLQILLTLNISECSDYSDFFNDLEIFIIENTHPRGFGANHNAAFLRAKGQIFVVLNPDIRAPNLNLEPLIESTHSLRVGACAPLVVSAEGIIEDSARRFPTLARFAKRSILKNRSLDYDINIKPISVDWVAGMFIAFRSEVFRMIGGFDERFFMYLEDADICRRLRSKNLLTIVNPLCIVVHEAQRASRKDKKHMLWHYRSALRFLFGI